MNSVPFIPPSDGLPNAFFLWLLRRGGAFLIVPGLLLAIGLPLPLVIGTSLLAVAAFASVPSSEPLSILAAQGQDLGTLGLTMVVFGIGAALPHLPPLSLLSREALIRWRGRRLAIGKGTKTTSVQSFLPLSRSDGRVSRAGAGLQVRLSNSSDNLAPASSACVIRRRLRATSTSEPHIRRICSTSWGSAALARERVIFRSRM
jgi:hypothetical protein